MTLLHPDTIPERDGVAATWSNIKREGGWILPRHFRALAVMGGVELDLTRVALGEGESEIEVLVIFGSVKITIPQGINVICDGDAVMGSFNVRHNDGNASPPGAPTIRITGSAYMGSVDVNIWQPEKANWIGRFPGQDDVF
ncbi:MAG: cell wall-active antibiotics response protein [Gemmatimonadota bacterium]|nr:cell wall-active antibiotics response protein [Gemmatimonadota bacterium]